MAFAFLNGISGEKKLEQQTKTLEVSENGSYDVIPDEDKTLSSVKIDVAVPTKEEILKTLIDGSINEVVVSEGIEKIRPAAFRECTNLTKAVLPSTLTKVSKQAFYLCDQLTDINFPDGITAIGNSAFSGCYKLSSVTLPESVTSIESTAFNWCAITEFTFPNKVSLIDDRVLLSCTSLTKVKAPSAVQKIEDYAFGDCSLCTLYDFSESQVVPTLYNVNAFNNINPDAKILVPAFLYNEWITATNWCQEGIVEHIVGTLDGTGGLEYSYHDTLGGYVVAGIGTCTDTEIVIPSLNENGNRVVGIGEHAFSNAEKVTKVTIPGSVYYLDNFCFTASVAEEIIFAAESGDSTRIICEAAFSFMHNIKIIDFTACKRIPVLNSSAIFTDAAYDELEVRVPAELYDDWINATNWTLYEEYIVPVSDTSSD